MALELAEVISADGTAGTRCRQAPRQRVRPPVSAPTTRHPPVRPIGGCTLRQGGYERCAHRQAAKERHVARQTRGTKQPNKMRREETGLGFGQEPGADWRHYEELGLSPFLEAAVEG